MLKCRSENEAAPDAFRLVLAVLAVLAFWSPAHAAAVKIHLYNGTADRVLVGECAEDARVTVQPGETLACESDDPQAFALGLSGGELAELNVTGEGDFDLAVTFEGQSFRIRGNQEGNIVSDPANQRYYVYAWIVEESR